MIVVKHAEPTATSKGRAYIYINGHYTGSLIFTTLDEMNLMMGHLQDGRSAVTFEPVKKPA